MKIDGNAPAFGVGTDNYHVEGLSKREYFARIASEDFDKFSISLQIGIIGEEPPSFTIGNETNVVFNLEYVKWLAKGRAIWKVMQADALIEALNKEE